MSAEDRLGAADPGGFVVWLTGLPAAGKSTVACRLRPRLEALGLSIRILDSDRLRRRITPELGYGPEERDRFYGILVDLAERLSRQGVNVIIAATGSLRRYRDEARRRITRFAEVHLDCDPAICRQRDKKGLWDMARLSAANELPGAGAPYERPLAPDLHLDTGKVTPEAAAMMIEEMLAERGFLTRLQAG